MDEPGTLATAPLPVEEDMAPPGFLGAVRPTGLGSGTLPGEGSGRSCAALLGGLHGVEEQLRRLEARLVAEAGGDPARELEARRLMALSRARFEAATVRTFLPILIERDVRRQLSGS
jgi:hypothetical protein